MTYSSPLQFLLDAENPVRVPVGDGRRMMAASLEALGLVEYRKSGWWATSEAGHQLMGGAGSGGVEGFKLGLQNLIDRALVRESLMNRPRGLTTRQTVKANSVLAAARYLGRINARVENEPAR